MRHTQNIGLSNNINEVCSFFLVLRPKMVFFSLRKIRSIGIVTAQVLEIEKQTINLIDAQLFRLVCWF